MLGDARVMIQYVDRRRAQDAGAPAVNDQHHLALDGREEAAQARGGLVAVAAVEIEARHRFGLSARDALVEAGRPLGRSAMFGFASTVLQSVRVETLDRLLEQRAIGFAVASGARRRRHFAFAFHGLETGRTQPRRPLTIPP